MDEVINVSGGNTPQQQLELCILLLSLAGKVLNLFQIYFHTQNYKKKGWCFTTHILFATLWQRYFKRNAQLTMFNYQLMLMTNQ